MLRNERLSSARSRLVSEHLLEYGDGLLHLVQRPVRNAARRLLERRSVARHEHATVNPPSTSSAGGTAVDRARYVYRGEVGQRAVKNYTRAR
jgi:hypothetical protein